MSITNEALRRFWRTMGERYGKRWLDSYGDEPTHAWRDCLNPFAPADIQRAINLLAENPETQQHPPTEPAFRALLQRAVRLGAKKTDDPAEARRSFWRSTIVGEVATALGYRTRPIEFEALVVANKDSLGKSMSLLLDEVDDLEASTGQRTSGQVDMVFERCRAIGVAFNALKAAQK